MICRVCGKDTYRTWSYIKDGVLHSDECSDCYPDGQFNSFSRLQKIRSRSLAPDGRTVLTGMQGQKLNDLKRRRQANDTRNSTVS